MINIILLVATRLSIFVRMKGLLVFILIATMLVKPLWPIAEYVMNYDYIVDVLCENKERPKLNCDGKCYLAKQLAKESGQDDTNPFNERQSRTEILHIVFFEPLPRIHLAMYGEAFKRTILKQTQFSGQIFLLRISPNPQS